tara:strand:- start:2476 stop:7158 length:4683 start_codon:yes stop_codon:yes gene_type:complete
MMIARQMMTLRSLGLGALALVLALVASGLGPVETASAYVPGSVNKTVTVTAADGSLVNGALVAFVYEDGTSEQLTSIETTGSDGVAVVAFNAALEILGLAVSPGGSDTTNALYFSRTGEDFNLTPSDQSFTVQLEAADITADLKLENSSAAPNGSMIGWEVPDTDLGSQVRILRSGPVGIALPGAAESYPVYEEGDSSYTFGYFVTGGHSGSGYFYSFYDFARVADVAGTETYGFSYFGDLLSPTEGLNNYTFVLRESNFSGQFVQDSSDFDLPSGVTASIRFIEAEDSSSIPPTPDTGRMGRSAIANVAANGSFAGFVDSMPGEGDEPVAYFPQVFFEGDASYPVFTGDPVWMWDGKFTTTSPWTTGSLVTSGISATTAPIEIPASPGAKNIIIQAVAAGTSTAQAADIDIISMDGQQWYGTVSSNTGIAAYNLADGEYQMEIKSTERRMGSKRYKIVVASGTPTVFVDEGDDTSEVSGDSGTPETFEVSGRVNPDFQVIVADPLNGDALIPQAEAHVEYCSTTECFGIGANEHNGVIQVQVPADIVSGMEGTLVIRPPSSGAYPLLTTKKITLSWESGNPVLMDGDTLLTAIADADADTYLVALGAANLSGTVFDPSGTTPIAYSGIAVVDASSGEDLWNYQTETNDSGEWALSLPTGTYNLYANSPWGQSDYGRSVLATGVVIDANGDATSVPSPSTASSFNFNLTFPTWSGTVVDPVDGNVVTNVEVCLYTSTSHACAQVDNNGRWALSAPDGYTSYGVSDELQVREYTSPLYADQHYKGTTQLSAALGSFTQNQQETDITLTLGQPNVLLTIQAGGVAVPYAWVNLESNFDWLGGASTDANGVARFSIDSPEDGFDVRVEISQLDINGTYTSTNKSYSSGDATTAMGGTSVFTQTVALDTPNLRLQVNGSDASAHPNAWVELFDASTSQWIAGSQSSSTGAASLNVPLPDTGSKNYTLRINPAWNDSTGDARVDYQVVVTSGGSVTVTGETASDGIYTVPLASPNLTGVVRNSSDSSTVADSWVSPYNTVTGEHLWNYGANSGSTGAFSMLLPDGSYELQAQVPWNLSGLASSARCAITVSGSAVSSSDAGCYSGGSMTLTLRQPNLQFTLMDNGTPVPFANVGIAVADWSVHAQSDLNGQVSLFLDQTAMKAAADLWISNGWMSAGVIPLRVWVDPPYGSSDIVRWECESGDASPICSDAAFTGLDKTGGTWAAWSDPDDLGNIEFKRPNTKIDILYPGGTAVGEGAWVGLFVEKSDGTNSWREWIGGGQTSSTGSVAFNIADANLGEAFSIEVNPPWYEEESYATKFYDDLVLSAADGSGIRALQTAGGSSDFRLSSPNLTLSVLESDSTTVSKYAWISVELMDESDGSHEWFSGSGTNFQGKAALMLPAQTGKHYRLNFYPGPYSEGTEFSCYLTSSGSDVVGAFSPTDAGTYSSENGYSSCGAPAAGALSKSFAAGNLSGTIQDSNGDAIAGAIVVAVGSSGGKELVATNATGEFFFDVDDTAETWTLKVISVDDTYTDRTDSTLNSADDDIVPITFSDNASAGNTITLVG